MTKKKLTMYGVIFLLFFLLSTNPSKLFNQVWKEPIHKDILSNGLTILFQKDDASAISVIQILIRGGKSADPEGKDGLAFMTTRICLEIPDDRTLKKIMDQATQLYMTCQSDFSLIQISCLSKNLEEALQTTIENIRKPIISGIRIDKIKRIMSQRQDIENDDPILIGHATARNIFFNNTPYANSYYGTEESIKSIKKNDVKTFFDQYFHGSNIIVSVSSDQPYKSVITMLKEEFQEFPQGNTITRSPIIPQEIPDKIIRFVEKDTLQSYISMVFQLPKLTSKNYVLVFLLENFIGKGIGSHLWPLRAEEKLAYNVNTRADLVPEGGFLEVYLETDHKKRNLATDELKKNIHTLYQKGLSGEELLVAKKYAKSTFFRQNETKEIRLQTITMFEALGLGYQFLNSLPVELEALTLDEVNSFIKEYLSPEKGVIIDVGPQSQTKTLKPLNDSRVEVAL